MAILLTEPLRSGEYLVSEVNTQSREVGVITGGAFLAGSVLGRITASKKLTQVNPAASDGSQTAVAVLYAYTDASTVDVQNTITARLTEVNGQVVHFPSGITISQQNAIVTQLAAVGILVRDPPIGVVAVVPSAPVNQSAPTISGSPVVGQTLSVSPGSWAAVPSSSYSYIWQRNGSTIVGATNSTYALVSGDAGASITANVTATNTAGNASATSAGVGPVTPSTSASITGTAPAGAVGTPYSNAFSTTGFSGTITPTLGSGSLPAGLSLSVSGTNIALSGTPTTAATSTFVIHAVGATSGTADSAGQSVTIAAQASNTRARFAQDTATAGVTSPAALFASMTQVAGATTDRNGTMTTTSDATKYTWVAVLASAAGSGMRFFDGTGYGGFNGAASSSIYFDDDADPTTIHQTYTDASGNVWNLYRSSGHSVATTFTLS